MLAPRQSGGSFMIYAVYDAGTGEIDRVVDTPDFMKSKIDVLDGQSIAEIDTMIYNDCHYIKDGKLTPKPIVDKHISAADIEELQATVWELIKERRLQAVTSGVYVESVDKWFHTDEVSVTSYSTIAGMIALNNYEPVQWKVMDNMWILLTIPIFKELQIAISQKTNANYAIAEQHKSDMMKSDNPLEYDFSTGWV